MKAENNVGIADNVVWLKARGYVVYDLQVDEDLKCVIKKATCVHGTVGH